MTYQEAKELKENERYTVLEEVERVDFGYDEYFLFVKLREYQTGKVVLFDLLNQEVFDVLLQQILHQEFSFL